MIQTPREKKDHYILSRLKQLMRESGLVGSVMDTVFNAGLMVPNTKVNGKIIEPTVRVNSSISMETSMMVTG